MGCGSTAIHEDSKLEDTGPFTRVQAGGLFSVKPTSSIDLNTLYPPGSVSDLSLGNMDFQKRTFTVSFTWPGCVLDKGMVDSYKVFYSSNLTLMMGSNDLMNDPGVMEVTSANLQGGNLPPPSEAGEKALLGMVMDGIPEDRELYWRVMVEAAGGGSLSNMASLYLVNTDGQPAVYPSLTWGAAIGIFLGSFLATLLGIWAVMWYRARH